MSPSPRDSESEPDDIYDDMEYTIDEDAGIIVLDENDVDPSLNDPDIGDEEENGYIQDDTKMIFAGHEGSVFSIDQSKKEMNFIVTGGEDDKGFVWRQDTGELVFECEGHKDSVISCGFSNDGKFVMTADMSGVVIVHQVDNHTKIWDFESVDLEWCKWHTVLHVLFAGSTDGELYMWKIPSGDTKMFQGHGSKSTVGMFSNNGKELFAGYEDGKLVYWDLKTSTSIFTTNGDSDSILCIDYQKSGNLVACGTREGKIKLYSSPAGKLVNTFLTSTSISNETEQNDEEMLNSIESVAFSPNEQYLASASLQGDLDVWDLNTQRRRHSCKHSSGIINMIWSPDLPELIITACLDGVIRIWKALSGELIKEIYGHKGSVLDMVLSYDNKHLLTAGDDQTARIFEI